MILETDWDFSTARFDLDDDLVAIGADLAPGTVVAAYAAGVFPMGLGDGGAPPLGWWSPMRRGVLRRGDFHASRTLKRHRGRFVVTYDRAFDQVLEGCADPTRSGSWITDDIKSAYTRLYELGVAHSVEVWADGVLAGGLYGLALGGLFAGESMFHRQTDASKMAVWALSDAVFASSAPRLIDVQWQTPHLASLGVTELDRDAYRNNVLPELLNAPPIEQFAHGGTSKR